MTKYATTVGSGFGIQNYTKEYIYVKRLDGKSETVPKVIDL